MKVWEQSAFPSTSASSSGLAQDAGAANAGNANASNGGSGGSRWIERAALVDARGTVRSVEFAPRHFGLKLVSIRYLIHFSIC